MIENRGEVRRDPKTGEVIHTGMREVGGVAQAMAVLAKTGAEAWQRILHVAYNVRDIHQSR